MPRTARILVATLLGWLGCLAPVSAQWLLSDYLEGAADDKVRAAFAAPYGRAVAVEFAAVLHDSADAACLKAKGLGIVELTPRANAILLAQGTRIYEIFAKTIDPKEYDATLASIVPDAKEQLVRLRADPDVRVLLRYYEPARLAVIVDQVVDVIDRYAVEARLKLDRKIAPLKSGNAELRALDPIDKSIGAGDEFAEKSLSRMPAFYIELYQQTADALNKLHDKLDAVPLAVLAAGLDKELTELCIVGKP
jgi:hypothetical protein